MSIIQNLLHSLASGLGPFLILLGLLIFVHELGHFLVAKFFGVRVEVFSLGFGRKIFQYKRGDTTYCISIIPLGGYVKMFGDDPTAEVSSEDAPYSFLRKPVLQRIAIVLAGPLMNLAFAFVLYVAIATIGEPVSPSYVGDISASTRAHDAGFRSGDHIISINDQMVSRWKQVTDAIQRSVGERLTFVVERGQSTERVRIEVTPTLGANANILSSVRQVGVIEGLEQTSMGTVIGVNSSSSPAATAGLKSMDVITEINERPIRFWRDLEGTIQDEIGRGRSPLRLKVLSATDESAPVRDLQLEWPIAADIEKPALPTLVDIGISSGQTFLRAVKPQSPADLAGLKVGDRIITVNSKPVDAWEQVIEIVKDYDPDGPPIQFEFERDGQKMTANIVPELTEMLDGRGQDQRRYTVGIVSGYSQAMNDPIVARATNALEGLALAAQKTKESSVMIMMGIVRLIQGEVSARNVGGVFSIGKIANQAYDAGLIHFLQIMAVISINLFLLNLLPVPVLDGGHLVFYTIEALRGAPLSLRKMEVAQQVGLVLLMGLMLFALYNDISNWLESIW